MAGAETRNGPCDDPLNSVDTAGVDPVVADGYRGAVGRDDPRVPPGGATAMSDQIVIDFLRRRWRRVMDLTTVAQAQAALALPDNVTQRLRIHEALSNDRRLWRPIARYGANPLTVTLTEGEKLIARQMLDGSSFEAGCERAAVSGTAGLAAKRVLRAVGFLQRGRATSEPGPFLDGVGLQTHTVRVEGDHAYNVP